jgi:hypothetical protein
LKSVFLVSHCGDRQRSQNNINAEEPETVSPYREALLGAEK